MGFLILSAEALIVTCCWPRLFPSRTAASSPRRRLLHRQGNHGKSYRVDDGDKSTCSGGGGVDGSARSCRNDSGARSRRSDSGALSRLSDGQARSRKSDSGAASHRSLSGAMSRTSDGGPTSRRSDSGARSKRSDSGVRSRRSESGGSPCHSGGDADGGGGVRCSESGARGDGGAGYIEGEKGGGPSSVYPGRGHRPPTGRGGRNDLRWVWEAWLVLFEVSGSGF